MMMLLLLLLLLLRWKWWQNGVEKVEKFCTLDLD